MYKKSYAILLVSILLLAGSSLAWLYTFFATQYPGNKYIPAETLYIFTMTGLIYSGFHLLSGKNSSSARSVREFIYMLLVLVLVAYATNAVQYTPFKPIDKTLVAMQRHFNISLSAIIAWTYSYPWLRLTLEFSYATLPYQMSILPMVVIASRRYDLLREYYFLMLSSVFVGFIIYYFWPTTGPASVIDSSYFTEEQYATGLKFKQIHHYIKPTTIEGGMIALPSYHVIWAWMCLYLIRPWKIAFSMLLVINVVLISACVLLGWHYPIDIVASVIIMLFCHWILARINHQKK